jgi:hypothetical protein
LVVTGKVVGFEVRYQKGVEMARIKTKGLALAVIGLSLFLFVPACLSVAPQSTQAVQVVYPTIVITQYVTQVVATPTITPTPLPASASNQTLSVVQVGWDPFTVEIYYPIVGCVASRLHGGDVAFIANGGVDLIQSKDIGYSPVTRKLTPGEMVDITKGPWCSGGNLIWKVATAEGEEGFASEGNGDTYWLLPMPPGTDSVVAKDPNSLWNGLNRWLTRRFRRDPRE